MQDAAGMQAAAVWRTGRGGELLEWQLAVTTSWALYYSHFLAGPAVTDAGGRDVDFLGSWIEFKY